MCVLLFLFLYSIPSSSNANGIHLDFFFWPVRLTEEKLLFVGDRSKGFSFCQKRFFHTIPVAELDMYLVSTTHNMIVVGTYLPYMYFFFLDELRKFTISDFPKQTHLGYILMTLFFSYTL